MYVRRVNIPLPREEIVAWLASDEPLTLIETGVLEDYVAGHLPGAEYLSVDVDAHDPGVLPDRDVAIVVYGPPPEANLLVARLRVFGYAPVLRYLGGKRDWQAAELPLETGAPARRRPVYA